MDKETELKTLYEKAQATRETAKENLLKAKEVFEKAHAISMKIGYAYRAMLQSKLDTLKSQTN